MKLGTTPGGGLRPGPRSIASAIAVALFCAILNVWAILQRFYLDGGGITAIHICDSNDRVPFFVAAYVDMAGTCIRSEFVERESACRCTMHESKHHCPMRAFTATTCARKR